MMTRLWKLVTAASIACSVSITKLFRRRALECSTPACFAEAESSCGSPKLLSPLHEIELFEESMFCHVEDPSSQDRPPF